MQCEEGTATSGRGGFAKALIAAAVLAYAVDGFPAPDRIGVTEIIVASALCAAVAVHCGWAGLAGHATVGGSGARLLALLALPAGVTGALSGASVDDSLRDAAALTPFALPVLLAGSIRGVEDRRRLADLLAVSGAIIAVRYLDLVGWPPRLASSASFEPINLAYLPNEPIVAFAAGLGVVRAVDRAAEGRWFGVLVWSAVATSSGLALAASLQRAALVHLVIATCLAGLRLWRKRRGAVLAVAPLALAAAVAIGNEAVDLVRAFLAKTRVSGTNARLDEIRAALAMATVSPGTLIFGSGWGIRVETPTVAGFRVLYMHVLPALLLAKTGLIGLVAAGAAAWRAIPPVRAAIAEGLPEALALLGPILIACTLHTGYRSLGIGFLLLLLFAGSSNKAEDRCAT